MLDVLLMIQFLCGPAAGVDCVVSWDKIQPKPPMAAFEQVVLGTTDGRIMVCRIKNTARADCYWAEAKDGSS